MSYRTALFATLVVGSAADAQVSTRMLERAEHEHPDPFTRITYIRELRDRRVVVADARDAQLFLVDLARGAKTTVARQGAGPREFRVPAALTALPGDSTWVWDVMNARWLVLDPAAAPVGTLAFRDAPQMVWTAEYFGVDAAGRLYAQREGYNAERPSDGATGETVIVRVDRRTWKIDTVTTLRVPKGRQMGARSLPGGMIRDINNRPLAPEDIAAVAPDGRVAVVRVPEYRVEWHPVTGTAVVGAPIEHERIPVTDAERRAFVQSQTRPGKIFVVQHPSGATKSAPTPRITRMPEGALDEEANSLPWPSHLPPVRGTALVDPSGTLWVPRSRPHNDSTPSFDLVDGRGRVTARMRLPVRTRLAGFGQGSVYLVRVDDDDLEYLQRYRLP